MDTASSCFAERRSTARGTVYRFGLECLVLPELISLVLLLLRWFKRIEHLERMCPFHLAGAGGSAPKV